MTANPLEYSNKATGFENSDFIHIVEPIPPELTEQRDGRPVQEFEYLAEINELKAKLETANQRGDDFIYKMLAAERKQIQAEALAANRLTEINKLDAELTKYAKLEEYLFQTMQVAQDQREKYLDGLEGE